MTSQQFGLSAFEVGLASFWPQFCFRKVVPIPGIDRRKLYGCTDLNMPESREMIERTDLEGTAKSQMAYVAEYLKC